MTAPLPLWGLALAAGAGVVLVKWGPGTLTRLLGRSFVGLVFLALLGQTGLMPGFLPGANLLNALILGALGAPGFGLLLLLPILFG